MWWHRNHGRIYPQGEFPSPIGPAWMPAYYIAAGIIAAFLVAEGIGNIRGTTLYPVRDRYTIGLGIGQTTLAAALVTGIIFCVATKQQW